MMKLLLPILLLVIGTGAGIGAGVLLKPEPVEEEQTAAVDCVPGDTQVAAETPPKPEPVAYDPDAEPPEYANLTNQFVVPVVNNDQIVAMVVLSIGVAVPAGGSDAVYAVEPRLRDKMLQVMFNHANIGGFSGNFTASSNMRSLRRDLLGSAQEILGEDALDVLILDIVRQDV